MDNGSILDFEGLDEVLCHIFDHIDDLALGTLLRTICRLFHDIGEV